MSQGWIKIHRKITDHWLWQEEFSYGQAWIDLLLNANHKDKKELIKNKIICIKRGQQIRTERTLSAHWKWSRGKVRRFLKNLENEHMIERETGPLVSIISICNYKDFQTNEKEDSTTDEPQTVPRTNHRQYHAQYHGQYPNKNVKNVKNEKNEKNVKKKNICANAHGFAQFWDAYPVKKDKSRAQKSWLKIKPDDELVKKILSSISQQKIEKDVLTKNNQFCPQWKNPATWLNGKCWEDEITKTSVEVSSRQREIYEWIHGQDQNDIEGEFHEVERQGSFF